MDSNDKVKSRLAQRVKLEVKLEHEDCQVASFAALAILIHIAESALPTLLPGVKPGLANVVTLICLQMYGVRIACWVAILRVVVGSLLLGTFLGPPFMLSFSGAMASLLMLLLMHKWNECCTPAVTESEPMNNGAPLISGAPLDAKATSANLNNWPQQPLTQQVTKTWRIGAVGMSIIAAQAHIAAQFVVAYLLFVPHPGLFSLLPVMLTAAVIFGGLSGMIASVVLRRMSRHPA